MRMKKTKGLPPGTPVYTGEFTDEPLSLNLFQYNTDTCTESEYSSVPDLQKALKPDVYQWINLNGVNHIDAVSALGELFQVHSLLLEDIVHTGQRPKFEEFDEHLIVIANMLRLDGEEILKEQICMVLYKNTVITFQEKAGDLFDPIRDRLRNNKGKVRSRGSDYLFYALLDVLVDHYFTIIEYMGEKLEAMEDRILSPMDTQSIQEIQDMKRDMVNVRTSIYPIREMLGTIIRDESDLFEAETFRYFTDIYEHSIQIIETLETHKEIMGGVRDLYMSSISMEMNKVMQVLTVISTIFIPLTFIAGVYGMNFTNIPAIGWKYGYFVVWGIMALVAIGLLLFFKKRKWL